MYPVALVAGLALSAAGAGMGMAADAQSRSAMNDAQSAELLRQRKFQDEADQAFKSNLESSSRASADVEQANAAAARQGEYAAVDRSGAGVEAPIYQNTSGADNPNSAAASAARNKSAVTASGNAWSKLVGAARARLGAGEDWQLGQSIRNTRANQDLAIASNRARTSAAVLPYEMDAAYHSGDALRAWGSLAGALGSTVGTYGASTYGATTDGVTPEPQAQESVPVMGYGWNGRQR